MDLMDFLSEQSSWHSLPKHCNFESKIHFDWLGFARSRLQYEIFDEPTKEALKNDSYYTSIWTPEIEMLQYIFSLEELVTDCVNLFEEKEKRRKNKQIESILWWNYWRKTLLWRIESKNYWFVWKWHIKSKKKMKDLIFEILF